MDLPDWLTPLPDAAQQRALDTWAIEQHHIPSETLMERAGSALARVCTELVAEGRIVIACGRGNNGGDGHVAARVLRQLGREVTVVDVGAEDAPSLSAALDGAAAVVDALLGTGFSGAPREPISAAITAINAARRAAPEMRVVACDMPSGVDGSSGEIGAEAVCADATVTFHAAKPGLWIAPGKQHSGVLHVVDIGIPADGQPVAPGVGLISERVGAEVPRRHAGSTKFSVGSVVVVGGSRGLTGAPVLAALAAARAGAGYVTIAAPASVVPMIAGKLLEVMTVELPDDPETGPRRGSSRMAVERAARAQALVLGPGIGRLAAAQKFARDVALHARLPLVLDADGLNAHAEEGGLEQLTKRSAATVLTPHVGELARLLEVASADIESHRLEHVRAAAERAQAIVVLKGDDTLVAEPGGRVAVSPGGAPALATAGTGDVLAGVIGAFLAKGIDPFTAACAAVATHLAAGVIAAEQIGAEGVIASDVVAALPRARGRRFDQTPGER
ncbi:MAG TPA: NAD(P)H-hydrate dehydratase [Solirubrobacteraceae bacterium]|jgi:NAD(P)H-hydrate epimerase|nr:NAD(P)H-hydrate dehydratase [Solirubrobacteraceae bacterium]